MDARVAGVYDMRWGMDARVAGVVDLARGMDARVAGVVDLAMGNGRSRCGRMWRASRCQKARRYCKGGEKT